jgi:transposase-like protein
MTLSMADMPSGDSTDPRGKGTGVVGPRSGRPTRRTFTDAYKLAIVIEYEALTEHGARGALLRREGLYESNVTKWRRAHARGTLIAAPARADKSSPTESTEIRRLRRENERLSAELAKTKAVLEVMGKAHALLEILSESADRE